MDTFVALAELSCTPVAGDLALSALPDAPVLPVRQPSAFRRLISRRDLSALHRRRRVIEALPNPTAKSKRLEPTTNVRSAT